MQRYNKSDKTYNIFFVDFGDSADVHRSNVQPIADWLVNDHKCYAIQCSLANIKPFGKMGKLFLCMLNLCPHLIALSVSYRTTTMTIKILLSCSVCLFVRFNLVQCGS